MKTITLINFFDMLYLLLPVGVVWYLYYRWTSEHITIGYALLRMVIQLLLIGYLLVYIFSFDSSLLVIIILSVMLVVASSISIRTLKVKDKRIYIYALIAISVSVFINLTLVTQAVLNIVPWYNPTYTIPLAGMLFATSMNAIALASERYESERAEKNHKQSRAIAFKTALIPIINSLFAVGVVSLPGMMTGQILSGIDPLIAVRYQIVVMFMLFSCAGMATAIYLTLVEERN